MTEGHGVPTGIVVDGANRVDAQLVEPTIESCPVRPPAPTPRKKQNLSLDAGYDNIEVRTLVASYGYTAHIRSRREEADPKRRIPGYRARRWVVERTHSWINRFRRLLIRWEKKAANYLGMLHIACAWITNRATEVFG